MSLTRRLAVAALGIAYVVLALAVVALALTGCGPSLADQQRMRGHVAAALRSCKQDGARCAAAKSCKDAAVKARDAMNGARKAGASMLPTAELDVEAATLAAQADATCATFGGAK